MSSKTTQLIENLNHDNMTVRLESLRSLMAGIGSGELQRPHTGRDVNNHIHTTFFSPYSCQISMDGLSGRPGHSRNYGS